MNNLKYEIDETDGDDGWADDGLSDVESDVEIFTKSEHCVAKSQVRDAPSNNLRLAPETFDEDDVDLSDSAWSNHDDIDSFQDANSRGSSNIPP